jgi:hypothetical protein
MKNINIFMQLIFQSSSYGTEYPPTNSSIPFGPPWFSPTSQPPPFPIPHLPFNPCKNNISYQKIKNDFILRILAQFPHPPFNPQSPFFPPPPPPSVSNNPSNFIPPPFLPPPPTGSFSLPPPDLLSKMLQTPPPPLPVPPPVNNPPTTITNTTIKNEDLYDPLKAEDEDEEDSEQNKQSPPQKPSNRTFNIKKEYPIKIEPSNNLIKTKILFIYLFIFFRSIFINEYKSKVLF